MLAPPGSSKYDGNQVNGSLIWPPLRIGQGRAAKNGPKGALASFHLALQEGAEGIVLNVQLSTKGIPVVMQADAGSTRSSRYSSPARQQHASAPLTLLSEVLHWVRAQRCMAFIAVGSLTPGAEVKVLKEIDRAQVRHLTRLVAASLNGLERIRQLDATVNLGLLFSGRPPAIRHANALGAEVLLPHSKITSPLLIRRAHRASMLVIPWTVDSERPMRRAILWGVDGIITNYPAALAKTIARLQESQRRTKR